jgi:SAM-dependent methyltransferase
MTQRTLPHGLALVQVNSNEKHVADCMLIPLQARLAATRPIGYRLTMPGVCDRAADHRSYQRTLERFGSPQVAGCYPSQYRPTLRDRRERRAILKALDAVAAGASILDLPCGTGRLTPLLVKHGLRVTSADSSPHMVAMAQRTWRQAAGDCRMSSEAVQFAVRDVTDTGYADGQFDATVCNRLFHHFTEAATRRLALAELRRITAGPVIVSFFNAFALESLRFRFKHWRRGTWPLDRIPIPLAVFEEDIAAAGLRIDRRIAVMWGVSPQWYLVLRRV